MMNLYIRAQYEDIIQILSISILHMATVGSKQELVLIKKDIESTQTH